MKFYKTYCLILFLGFNCLHGKISHLLVSSIGNGVVHADDSKKKKTISTSSFLPKNTKLSVPAKSGIETLAAGYLFRFGASTSFLCREESLELFSGSLFVRSRNFKNSINIIGPEISIKLSGAGSCLIEVEKNGGLKCVGLLGSLRLSLQDKSAVSLLPGELVFTELKSKKLSDKVSIELGSLFETSFLISGFPNSSSFQDALNSVAESQKLVIAKSYGATVGDTSGSDKFEINSPPSSVSNTDDMGISSMTKPYLTNYQLPDESPLMELLGRNPKRIQLPESNSLPGGSNNSSETRPFPSRLLRGN